MNRAKNVDAQVPKNAITTTLDSIFGNDLDLDIGTIALITKDRKIGKALGLQSVANL